MPKKMSLSEKWSDPWFRKLEPEAKLLFLYLCDVCDCAGFVELDMELSEFQTKLSFDELEGALKGLSPKVVCCGKWLWVVNHIKHQQNYPAKPLNPSNKAHQGIWSRLSAHLDMEEVKAFVDSMDKEARAGFIAISSLSGEGAPKGLTSHTSKGNGYGNGKGNGSLEGGWGETVLAGFESFKQVHKECAVVSEVNFVAAVQACVEGDKRPDVEEAVEAFRMDFADIQTFRPTPPIREFKKYLRKSVRVATEAAAGGNPSRPRLPAGS